MSSCAILCQIVSLQYLSRSSLHCLVGLLCQDFLSWSTSGDTRGPSVCPAQNHFIFPIINSWLSMACVFSRTQMLVLLALYVMLSILLSILVCATASLFCGCLTSAHVYMFHCHHLLPWSPNHSWKHTWVTCTPVFSGRWHGCIWRTPGVWRIPPSMPWLFLVCPCPGSFPWVCSVSPGVSCIRHFLSATWRWRWCSLQPLLLSTVCVSEQMRSMCTNLPVPGTNWGRGILNPQPTKWNRPPMWKSSWSW